jgi:lipoyl synthase
VFVNEPARFAPKPPWLKVRAPGGERYGELKDTFRSLDLHTVCEEARCPNVGECWGEGTATVMLLGDTCTRGCRFCAVTTGQPRGAVDGREPEHVARALSRMPLQYVVMTMVDRDDLGGHLDAVDTTVDAGPDVWAHNIEVVRRLQRTIRDVRCSYDQSLGVLRRVKERAGSPTTITKSSIMVGIGETDDEVLATMRDLRSAGVDIVTVGQYLRPTPRHAPVDRYVEPERFDAFAREGRAMGFAYVASGPLVRSSYKAAEVFVRSVLLPNDPAGAEAVLRDRLARANALGEKASSAEPGATVASTSELAARAAASLVPASSLVRR